MSQPNIQYMRPGSEKRSSSTKNTGIKLGQLMILPTGEEFHYCRASATAMVAGKFYQQNIGIQGSDAAYIATLAVAAAASAQCTVVVTAGATTAVTADQFADGIMAVCSSAGSGNGYAYHIKSCSSAAAGATTTITLEQGDPLKVALVAGTNTVGLRENPYFALTLTTADTIGVGALAGVSPTAITANYYGWVQTQGPCMCLTDGTLIVGEPVSVSNAVAGAVEPIPPAAADTIGTRVVKQMVKVGVVMNVAANTAYSLIDLDIK